MGPRRIFFPEGGRPRDRKTCCALLVLGEVNGGGGWWWGGGGGGVCGGGGGGGGRGGGGGGGGICRWSVDSSHKWLLISLMFPMLSNNRLICQWIAVTLMWHYCNAVQRHGLVNSLTKFPFLFSIVVLHIQNRVDLSRNISQVYGTAATARDGLHYKKHLKSLLLVWIDFNPSNDK